MIYKKISQEKYHSLYRGVYSKGDIIKCWFCEKDLLLETALIFVEFDNDTVCGIVKTCSESCFNCFVLKSV